MSHLEQFQNDQKAFVWAHIKEAQKLKKARFLISVPLKLKEFESNQLKLATNAHYYEQLEDYAFKLKQAKAEIDDINERYDHYVACEKITLPDRFFVKIDKLLAKLNDLKSRLTEAKKYTRTKTK